MPAPPARYEPGEYLALSQKYGQLAVALNLEGQRFADESAGAGDEVLNQHIAQQSGACAVFVLPAELLDRPSAGDGTPRAAIERARAHHAEVVERDTLDELCLALGRWGVPGDRARHTLTRYDEAIAAGSHGLNPSRERNRHRLSPGPLLAVRVLAGMTFTGGGISTDDGLRVLRSDGTVIDGLFAAGCDVGGFSTYDYMGGLAPALVTGRTAGQAAATTARPTAHAPSSSRPAGAPSTV